MLDSGQKSGTVGGRVHRDLLFMAHQQEKEAAARASLRFVHDGNVVGLGSGSTAACLIPFLAERVRAGLKIRGIPTSAQTQELAKASHVPLTTFNEVPQIDVTIDGADEFDPQLNLIKGGGGALLHEKIVASASRLFVIVADSSKQVPVLGKFPLPVEVIPFADPLLIRRITSLGARVQLRQRPDGSPYVTDEHNHILDCQFGQMSDPAALARELDAMPGIVEHGLFVRMADIVLLAKGVEVQELRRDNSRLPG
ncbi:MAG TPA: ribose-5-phosphate isomerase RpiA [Terriglobales bacterium]|nr:ribose-5-phosphate isomerase RpiA [Terriglobales bacterium]